MPLGIIPPLYIYSILYLAHPKVEHRMPHDRRHSQAVGAEQHEEDLVGMGPETVRPVRPVTARRTLPRPIPGAWGISLRTMTSRSTLANVSGSQDTVKATTIATNVHLTLFVVGGGILQVCAPPNAQ